MQQLMLDITPKAVSKVKEIMKSEGKESSGLRVKLIPGGCAGFMYDFLIEAKADKGDKVIEKDGLKVFIDEDSLQFMEGAVIDYIEGLKETGFKVNNPNFHHSCNCGKSVG